MKSCKKELTTEETVLNGIIGDGENFCAECHIEQMDISEGKRETIIESAYNAFAPSCENREGDIFCGLKDMVRNAPDQEPEPQPCSIDCPAIKQKLKDAGVE